MNFVLSHKSQFANSVIITFRPVFKPYSLELDTYSDFVLYRTESNKILEEDLIKQLQDLKRPEKQGKWMPILGTLKVNMYTFKTTLQSKSVYVESN